MVQQAIPLSYLDDRIRSLDAEIARLTTERELITSLRSHAIALGTEEPTHQKMTLTDRVLQHMVRYPGMTSSEIADNFISSGVPIGGADARKTILTIIGALATKKRIDKREDGRLFPV